MTILKFSDGEEFDTFGELRLEHRSDGWYVLGRGMLIPVRDEEEGKQRINQLEDKVLKKEVSNEIG